MTENRRIVLNIAATYARSVFALVCAVFTSRWVLQSLGEVSYGLLGVVGSLFPFITFVNGVLSMSVARFYAYSVGAERTAEDKARALEECRAWFSVSVTIHLVGPAVVLVAGWVLGSWIIENWLTIPPERVGDCLFIFRLSCVGSFAGLAMVPFLAMYAAKQEIATSTVVSLAGTIGLVLFSGYMACHPRDWMVPFAVFTCLSGMLLALLQSIRAVFIFPECRLRPAEMFNKRRLRELFSFAGWGFVGPLGILLRTQGLMILVNKGFGPAANAALSLARTVCERSNTLSGSVKASMAPAVVQACGGGDDVRMQALVRRMCKFALLATLAVALPLLLEIDEVLLVWLVEPPAHLSGLVVCLVLEYILSVATSGYDTAVYAKGRIAAYQCVAGVVSIMTLPVAYLAVRMGCGVVPTVSAVVCMSAVFSAVRLYMASRLTGMSIVGWVRGLLLPVMPAAAASLAAGALPRLLAEPGLARLAATVAASALAFLPAMWRFSLDEEEKSIVRAKLRLPGGRP